MTDTLVRNAAELTAALTIAAGGDTIRLAAGDYGDVTISRKVFSTALTITSADPAQAASFHSLNITYSSGIALDVVRLDFMPTEATTRSMAALRIAYSTNVSVTNSVIVGDPAINGVPQDADTLDATGNVLGLPAGRGVTVESSSNVTIRGMDISQVDKGIVLSKSTEVVIQGSQIHDTRGSPIVGGGLSNITVESNRMWNLNPWGGLADGTKDHADFIHFWTADGQTLASTGIRIVDNVMEQGTGASPLGIYLDDNGHGVGFSGAEVSGNLLVNGFHMGIVLERVMNSTISNNTLLKPESGTRAPGIVIAGVSTGLEVYGNLTAFVSDTATGEHIHDNWLVQRTDAEAQGFYTDALIDAANDYLGYDAHAYAMANIVTRGVRLQSPSGAGALLIGGSGNDTLVGLSGADTLRGGGGNDQIIGNGGNDVLSGGAGADTFVFAKGHETSGGADTILDFSSLQRDKINVHSIDANKNLTSDQNFTFIATAGFHRLAGELRYERHGTDAWVMGDVNGDGIKDFTIVVVGVGRLIAGDFIL